MLNQDIYDLARKSSVPIEKVAAALNYSEKQLVKKLSKKLTSDFRYNIIYIILHLSLLLDDITADFLTDLYCGELTLKKITNNFYSIIDCDGVVVGEINIRSSEERRMLNEFTKNANT